MSSKRVYVDTISSQDKLRRLVWRICFLSLFYPTPNSGFNRWRIFLLRIFGASIGKNCKVSSTSRIWAPWNLSMKDWVCLAELSEIYNVDVVYLENHATVSQRATLCSASHRIDSLSRPLITSPIRLEAHSWVCAEAFIGPGVNVGEGSVVGARAVVFKDVNSWDVVVGNPAQVIRKRAIEAE